MRLPFGILLALTIGSIAVAQETTDLADARSAINKSLRWLEKDMVAWRESNVCAACHHGPMYVWSSQVALRQGYPVNQQQLRAYSHWIIEDEQSRVFPKMSAVELTASSNAADRMTAAMLGHAKLSQPTLYLAHALNAMPSDDPLALSGWQKIQANWPAAQQENGSFAGRMAWPPIFNSPQILTLFAATALHDRSLLNPARNKATDSLDEVHRRAAKFLENQTPDNTHQGAVLRLLRQTQLKEDPQALLSELLSRQRSDGGWSQTADRPSDAFATGQTLYVLHRAGLSLYDQAVIRGLKFLAQSQLADGTWPMTSRANPETGRPADDLNPITYAATAWATVGMASYVPAE